MSIMIHRGECDYGPYSVEQVEDLVKQQVLKEDDNAFVEGGAVWRPLGELLAEQRAGGAKSDAAKGPGILPLVGGLVLVLLLAAGLAYEMRDSLESLWTVAHSLSPR